MSFRTRFAVVTVLLALTTVGWPAAAQDVGDVTFVLPLPDLAPAPRSLSYLPYMFGEGPTARATGPGWTAVTNDDFEGTWPRPGWDSFSNRPATEGDYCWKNSGYQGHQSSSSAWPAAGCPGALSPATSPYPDRADSWMVYGPFSLLGATDAQVRFKLWQQVAGQFQDGVIVGDSLLWAASVDGAAFYGYGSVGSTTGTPPPTTEGWSDIAFDLTAVPVLESLLGQPQVWVAWVFRSDEGIVDRGPFVDDVVIERVAPPAPSGNTGGRGFGLNRSPASTNLTWTGGSAQSGYQVVRVGLPTGRPTFLPVAGNVSTFADNGTFTDPVVCYVLAPMQQTTPLGLSDTLCVMAGTRTGARVPGQFTIRLNQSQTASLAWTAPGGQNGYLLVVVPLNGGQARFLPLVGTTTTTTHATNGVPTCYVLVAAQGTTVLGSTDVVCGVPGAASIPAGSGGAPGALATALPQVRGNLQPPPRP